jgi:hypothetical protein
VQQGETGYRSETARTKNRILRFFQVKLGLPFPLPGQRQRVLLRPSADQALDINRLRVRRRCNRENHGQRHHAIIPGGKRLELCLPSGKPASHVEPPMHEELMRCVALRLSGGRLPAASILIAILARPVVDLNIAGPR